MENYAVISPESFVRIPGIIVKVIHISYKLSTDFGVLSTVFWGGAHFKRYDELLSAGS